MYNPQDAQLVIGDVQALQVIKAQESHHLMSPSRARVRVALSEQLSLDDLLGAPARLSTFGTDDTQRHFTGIITSAAVLGRATQTLNEKLAPVFELEIQSRLALLQHRIDSRIFQPDGAHQNTTRDIVSLVLQECGIPSDAQNWSLSGSYAPRNYCTQYEESCLHFITRLLEEEGIYFWCGLNEDLAEVIFFSDQSQTASECREKLPFIPSSGGTTEEVSVYHFERAESLTHSKTTLRGFNFEKPKHTPSGSADSNADREPLEYYRASCPLDSDELCEARALVHQQASEAAARRIALASNAIDLSVGSQLSVQVQAEEQKVFLTSLETDYEYHPKNSGDVRSFQVVAQAVSATLPYRAQASTRKPLIEGHQTATVTAPTDTPEEGVHTDEFGRVKVRFHWDRWGSFDDSASCWIRVAQLQTSGSMVLPRVNWEVVVEFIDGDPDRPLVTGRVFNGRYPPPYELPAGKTRTSLQTSSSPEGGGKNEIRFDDTAGAEELMIHSQYNTAIAAANNRNSTITKDQTVTIKMNESIEVGANQTCKVTNGCKLSVGADQSLTVSGNHDDSTSALYGVTVGGAQSLAVGGNWMQMIGSPLDALVSLGAAKAAAVASAQAEKVFAEVSQTAQGALDALSGPVQGLQSQLGEVSNRMDQVSNGRMAALPGVLTGAVALPTAGDLLTQIGAAPAFAQEGANTDTSTGKIALGGAIESLVSGEIQGTAKALRTQGLGEGSATSGAAAGGSSGENVGGPAGDLSGFSEEDSAQGPGYAQQTIQGNHNETISLNRISLALEPINLNVTGDLLEEVQAGSIELVAGARAESVEGPATETAPALILVTQGAASTTSGGAGQLSIGGALVETVKGDYSLEAGVAVQLTAALHDVKAKTKLTLKCGASSIVIDGGGVTIQTPSFTLTGASVAAKKSVADG